MNPYLVIGLLVLVLFVVFLSAVLRMGHDPDPLTPLDPETLAHLRLLQARGVRRGAPTDGSTFHPPQSRSEYEGDHPPVGGPTPAA